MNKEQRVKALIDSGRFTETDRTWLMNTPEEGLSALEKAPKADAGAAAGTATTTETATSGQPAAATAAAGTTAQPPAQATAVAAATDTGNKPDATFEQFVSSAPAGLRDELRAAKKISDERRKTLSTLITTNKANKFTREQLDAKPLDELENIVALMNQAPTAAAGKVVQADFSGRGVPNTDASTDEDAIPAPPDLVSAIRAKRGIK
jgi:hypothetical protein